MKKITYLLSIFALVLCLTGCDDYDYKESVQTLFVVESDLDFAAIGGTGTIVTTSEKGAISAKSDKEWCTVTVSGMTVTVTVVAHTEIVNRTAVVTISSGNESVEVPVTQAPMLFIIDQLAVTAAWPLGTYEVPVTSDLPIEATSEETWINPTVSGKKVIIEVLENPYGRPRTGEVTVKSGEVKQTIVVTQKLQLISYGALLGNWTLHCTNAAGTTPYELDLTFTEKEAGKTFTVSGWPGGCAYDLSFNSQTSELILAMGQYAFKHQEWDMILVAFDNQAGRLSPASTIQLAGSWNKDIDNPEYTFVDNGTWSDYVVRAIGHGNYQDGVFLGSVYNARSNLRIVKK